MIIFWLLCHEKGPEHQHLVAALCLHLYVSPLNIYLTAYLNSNIPAVGENKACHITQASHDLWKIYMSRLT